MTPRLGEAGWWGSRSRGPRCCPREAEPWTGRPSAENWQRCWAVAYVWRGSDTDEFSHPKALDLWGQWRELRPGQEGSGGTECGRLCSGGHLQQALTKSPLSISAVPSGRPSRGRVTPVKGVCAQRVSSVLMSESYDQAGKPPALVILLLKLVLKRWCVRCWAHLPADRRCSRRRA